MKNFYRFLFAVTLAAFLLAGCIPGRAQETPEQGSGKALAHSTPTKMSGAEAGRRLGKAESISGTISMVSQEDELVALTDSNGVPFSFAVTGRTRIRIDGKAATLGELKDQVNKPATVDFVPMSNGDIARTVDVG